jgi:aminoglycoside/choline kinase family phosphotransferase
VLGPIVYDTSVLSSDKITSLKEFKPPIDDKVLKSYLDSSTDADQTLAMIKSYLGSCPKRE